MVFMMHLYKTDAKAYTQWIKHTDIVHHAHKNDTP
jgi:hypothetical protein